MHLWLRMRSYERERKQNRNTTCCWLGKRSKVKTVQLLLGISSGAAFHADTCWVPSAALCSCTVCAKETLGECLQKCVSCWYNVTQSEKIWVFLFTPTFSLHGSLFPPALPALPVYRSRSASRTWECCCSTSNDWWHIFLHRLLKQNQCLSKWPWWSLGPWCLTSGRHYKH